MKIFIINCLLQSNTIGKIVAPPQQKRQSGKSRFPPSSYYNKALLPSITMVVSQKAKYRVQIFIPVRQKNVEIVIEACLSPNHADIRGSPSGCLRKWTPKSSNDKPFTICISVEAQWKLGLLLIPRLDSNDAVYPFSHWHNARGGPAETTTKINIHVIRIPGEDKVDGVKKFSKSLFNGWKLPNWSKKGHILTGSNWANHKQEKLKEIYAKIHHIKCEN